MKNLHKPSFRFFVFASFSLLSCLWGNVYCFRAGDEARLLSAGIIETCWNYQSDKTTVLDFASDNKNTLYTAFSNGKLVAIDIKSADKIWEAEMSGEIVSAPLPDSENVYVAVDYATNQEVENDGNNESKARRGGRTILRSLNRLTGLTNWETRVPFMKKAYIFLNNNFLIVIGEKGSIYSIDKLVGKIVWSQTANFDLSAPPRLNLGKIVFGSVDGGIIVFSIDNKQTFDTKTATVPTAITNDRLGNIVWGDEKGFITSINAETNSKNWTLRKGAKISGVTLTREGLLVTCSDNFVYMFSAASGKMLWKRRLSGRISPVPLISDAFAVITLAAEPAAFAVHLKTGKVLQTFNLDNDNLFTSDFIKFENLFIYSTLRGLSAVSIDGKCSDKLSR